MREAAARAFARVALAGNPSDGYGGRTVAACVADWCAEAEVVPSGAMAIDAPEPEVEDLARAAVGRLAGLGADPAATGTVRVRTTIPRQVGLGGSSAIVIAVLRAAAAAHELVLEPDALAREALAAEVEDLGIAAGPQDRVVQAHEGVLDMDFGSGRVGALDATGLPPLLVAHQMRPGRPSGDAHADLRARFDRGDPEVVEGMRELAVLAASAAQAIEAHDSDALGDAMDGSLDARARIIDLDPDELEGARIAAGHGAPVNYAGSGGAVVALAPPEGEAALIRAWAEAGWTGRRIRIARTARR